MSHTPAPWVIRYSRNDYPYAIEAPGDANIRGAVGHVVRWGGIGFPSSPVALANAHLIAAAPTMHEALQMILERNAARIDDIHSIARAALSMAAARPQPETAGAK